MQQRINGSSISKVRLRALLCKHLTDGICCKVRRDDNASTGGSSEQDSCEVRVTVVAKDNRIVNAESTRQAGIAVPEHGAHLFFVAAQDHGDVIARCGLNSLDEDIDGLLAIDGPCELVRLIDDENLQGVERGACMYHRHMRGNYHISTHLAKSRV